MIIPARQKLARKRILAVQSSVQKAIDKICEDEKYKVTYAEINAALIGILSNNNGYELMTLWEKEK